MALNYVPSTLDDNGLKKGFAAAETGILLDTSSTTFNDEKLWQRNHSGTRVGFAHNFDPEVAVSIGGEVDDTTSGVSNVVFGTAQTLVNDELNGSDAAYGAVWGSGGDTHFGGSAIGKVFVNLDDGGLYLETGTIGGSRDGMRTISMDFISIPGLS